MNKHINNLDCVHLEPCRVRPWAYHRAGTRVACSKLGESGSIGRVDCAIANPKPAMLLASSRPHDHFSHQGHGHLDRTLGHGPPLPSMCIHRGGCGRTHCCTPRVGPPSCRRHRTSPSPCGPKHMPRTGCRAGHHVTPTEKSIMIRNYAELSLTIKK